MRALVVLVASCALAACVAGQRDARLVCSDAGGPTFDSGPFEAVLYPGQRGGATWQLRGHDGSAETYVQRPGERCRVVAEVVH